MVYQQTISLTTSGHGDMHDLTEDVLTIVRRSGIRIGTVNIFNLGVRAPWEPSNSSPDCSKTCRRSWIS